MEEIESQHSLQSRDEGSRSSGPEQARVDAEQAPNRLARVFEWLRWPLGLGVLAAVFYFQRHKLSEFWSQEKDWRFLLLALVFCGTGSVITFCRWHWLIVGAGIPYSLWNVLRLGSLGLFLNYAGPGVIGGDAFKAILIARGQPSRRAVAAATVVLDRIIGLLALFVLGAITSLFSPGIPDTWEHRAVRILLWVGSACGLLGVGLMLIPRVTRAFSWIGKIPVAGKIWNELLTGVAYYQERPVVLLAAFLASIVGHLFTIGGFYCCAIGLGGWAPSIIGHFYFMPFAEFVGFLAPTPGGMGTLEFAIQEGYAAMAGGEVTTSTARTAGLFAALAFRVINLMLAAIGAIFYMQAKADSSGERGA